MGRWSEIEIDFLKNNYGILSATEIGRRINKRESTVRAMASRLKISKQNEENLLKGCSGCIFLGRFGNGTNYCNYLCIMGKRRGCNIEDCTKKLTKKEVDEVFLKKVKEAKERVED